jgi:hypothetical protein
MKKRAARIALNKAATEIALPIFMGAQDRL